jgi:hypothetical protein
MQHVQLGGRHPVDIAFEDVDGNEVPAYIDQRAPPHEAWLIVDRDRGHRKTARRNGDQLQKGFEAVQNPKRIGCVELGAGFRNDQVVGLVVAHPLDLLTAVVGVNGERRVCSVCGLLQKNRRAPRELLFKAIHGTFHHLVVRA